MADTPRDTIEQALEELRQQTPYGSQAPSGTSQFFGKIGNYIKDGVNWGWTELNKLWNGLTGQTSAEATLKANQMNIENQNYWNQIAMEREDTAHQREVADLQAAGLNPWLSVGNGANAAAMSTAQAEPVDGSKILQATSAATLLAIVKLLAKK